jgi:hypothetical protein
MTTESDRQLGDPLELLLAYLDSYRDTIGRKLAGLGEADLRGSHLPSGWTPLGLLRHLVYMERRWIRWGFVAEPVTHPWADSDESGTGWYAPADESVDDLLAQMYAGGVATRQIVSGHDLSEPGAVGGRFSATPPPPTLGWILLHVLEEYARHAGHLDIARELADGAVGE